MMASRLARALPPALRPFGARAFCAALGALLLALFCLVPVALRGDVAEYALTTVAVASHGTPDVRLGDIEQARRALPFLAEPYELLAADLRAGRAEVYPAYLRGRAGGVYAIHFFGYGMLAAVPYKLFSLAGIAPLKAFQAVNLAAVFVLGLALLRLFGSAARALLGVGLFMLCGGLLYWTWSSPECLSAALLLAGLAFYTSGAAFAGALAAGIAAQQNPSIVAFFACVPLLQLALVHTRATPLAASLRAVLGRRQLLALCIGGLVALLPIFFNLYQFGTPSAIGGPHVQPRMVGLVRLLSFYFDLNQGMVIGLPAVLAALLFWGWRAPASSARRTALVLAACVLMSLLLALPTLAVRNWNSDAAGLMRYAFWGGMPLLFALLLRLRAYPRWPLAMLLAVGLVQSLAMVAAHRYGYLSFSPQAGWLLRHAPAWYHPEAEIFAERLARRENYMYADAVFVYEAGGAPVKTLFDSANPALELRLCGPGAHLARATAMVASVASWRYIDGAPRCLPGPRERIVAGAAQFKALDKQLLAQGWNMPEFGGGQWDGVWSEGRASRLDVALQPDWRPATLRLTGIYFGANVRTRVRVDGVDLGWQQLDRAPVLALPPRAPGAILLRIELEHEAPHVPAPGTEPRAMALFLHSVELD